MKNGLGQLDLAMAFGAGTAFINTPKALSQESGWHAQLFNVGCANASSATTMWSMLAALADCQSAINLNAERS